MRTTCRRSSRAVFLATLLAAAAAVAGASGAVAQQEGAIAGTVRDEASDSPLTAVRVEVLDAAAARVASALTAQGGTFRVTGLSPGTYALRFVLPGWDTRVLADQTVRAGETTSVTVRLVERSYNLNPITVTASKTEEKVLDAPAAVQVARTRDIQDQPAITVAEHVKGMAGVDIITTGLQGNYIVARGFNNIFSGSMLTMTDNRIARVPSLRANINHLNPTTNMDLERVEVVLGPASALYGPNAANGVLHEITRSPIDDPGVSLSVAGGLRQQDAASTAPPGSAALFEGADEEVFQAEGRAAARVSDRLGFKLSGQYFTGVEYLFNDPVEARQRQVAEACIASGFALADAACLNFAEGLDLTDPADRDLLVESVENVAAGRDNDVERWSLDGRVDIRPGDETTVILAGGRTQAVTSVDLTGLGAGQVEDWGYNYLQGRVLWKDLFVQAFWNKSDNDDTYLLRSGRPLVDKSSLFVAQAQHASRLGDRQRFVYGLDLLRTVPRTEGTINGQNEDDDDITEVGGYVQSETRLSPRFDLVLAARVDNHSKLEDPVFSPRAGLVFKPNNANTFRATYNRAFSTPTTLNLFLDISGGSVPLFGPFRYDVRAQGTTAGGLTFRREGGVPMHMSPFAPLLGASNRDLLPTTTVQLWAEAVAAAQALAQGGAIPPSLAQLLANLPPPTAEQVSVVAATLNPEKAAAGDPAPFDPTPGGLAGVDDIARLDPSITNTFEVGYAGLLAERLLLSANVWYSRIDDWVSALRVSTPNVFLNGEQLGAYLTQQFVGLVGVAFPDEATARATAAQVAGTLGAIPLGVATVEQAGGTDPALVLTYRNLGDVDLVGGDLAATLLLGPAQRWEVSGALSVVNKDQFTAGEGDDAEIIPLNAPTFKGSISVGYRQGETGINGRLRLRHQDGFDANSGVYVGRVDDFQVVDLNLGYRLPRFDGVAVQLDVQNLFDSEVRSFVGTPSLGRFALLRLRYDYSPF